MSVMLGDDLFEVLAQIAFYSRKSDAISESKGIFRLPFR